MGYDASSVDVWNENRSLRVDRAGLASSLGRTGSVRGVMNERRDPERWAVVTMYLAWVRAHLWPDRAA